MTRGNKARHSFSRFALPPCPFPMRYVIVNYQLRRVRNGRDRNSIQHIPANGVDRRGGRRARRRGESQRRTDGEDEERSGHTALQHPHLFQLRFHRACGVARGLRARRHGRHRQLRLPHPHRVQHAGGHHTGAARQTHDGQAFPAFRAKGARHTRRRGKGNSARGNSARRHHGARGGQTGVRRRRGGRRQLRSQRIADNGRARRHRQKCGRQGDVGQLRRVGQGALQGGTHRRRQLRHEDFQGRKVFQETHLRDMALADADSQGDEHSHRAPRHSAFLLQVFPRPVPAQRHRAHHHRLGDRHDTLGARRSCEHCVLRQRHTPFAAQDHRAGPLLRGNARACGCALPRQDGHHHRGQHGGQRHNPPRRIERRRDESHAQGGGRGHGRRERDGAGTCGVPRRRAGNRRDGKGNPLLLREKVERRARGRRELRPRRGGIRAPEKQRRNHRKGERTCRGGLPRARLRFVEKGL